MTPHPQCEDSNSDDDNVVSQLLLPDDETENLSTMVHPSQTPGPPPLDVTMPSSITLSFPSKYNSPNPDSELSASEFVETCKSDRKKGTVPRFINGEIMFAKQTKRGNSKNSTRHTMKVSSSS